MCCASEKRVRLVLSPSHRAWKFKSLIRKMEPKWSPQSNLDDGLRYWLFYACNNRDFCLMESTLAALGGSESARVKGDSYLCAYLASFVARIIFINLAVLYHMFHADSSFLILLIIITFVVDFTVIILAE